MKKKTLILLALFTINLYPSDISEKDILDGNFTFSNIEKIDQQYSSSISKSIESIFYKVSDKKEIIEKIKKEYSNSLFNKIPLCSRFAKKQDENDECFLECNGSTASAFNSDGQYALVGCNDGKVFLWDLSNQKKPIAILNGHSKSINSVAFSPDQKHAITSSLDGNINFWDISNLKSIKFDETASAEFRNLKNLNSFAPSPNGKFFIIADNFTMDDCLDFLLNLGPMPVPHLNSCTYDNTKIIFNENHRIIEYHLHGDVRLWNSLKLRYNFLCHTDRLKNWKQSLTNLQKINIAFSSDDKYVLIGSWDTVARLWNLSNLTYKKLENHSDQVTSVAISPNGKHAATGSYKQIKLWNLDDLKSTTLDFYSDKCHCKYIDSLAFSADGNYIAAASKRALKVYDVSSNINDPKEVLDLYNLNTITSIAFSPNGKDLLLTSRESGLFFANNNNGVTRLLNMPLLISNKLADDFDLKELLLILKLSKIMNLDLQEYKKHFKNSELKKHKELFNSLAYETRYCISKLFTKNELRKYMIEDPANIIYEYIGNNALEDK